MTAPSHRDVSGNLPLPELLPPGQPAESGADDRFGQCWLLAQCAAVDGALGGLLLLGEPDRGPFRPVAVWPSQQIDVTHLSAVAERALRERVGTFELTERTGAPSSVAYPLILNGRLLGVVALDVSHTTEHEPRQLLSTLAWGSGNLLIHLGARELAGRQAVVDNLVLNLDLIAVAQEHRHLEASARALVTDIAARLGFERVSIGQLVNDQVRVVAISHSAEFKESMVEIRLLAAAMEEACDQQAPIWLPAPDGEPLRIDRAAQELVKSTGSAAIAILPLLEMDGCFGALVLESALAERFDASTRQLCHAIAALLGPLLGLQRYGARSLPAHARETARNFTERFLGPAHPGIKLAAGVAALCVLLMVLIKGEYRVTADATLEGSVLRAAVAPFEGYIASAPVRAGDRVKAGQLLCELDDRDLAVEQEKLVSRREQLVRQLREAGAKHEWADVGVLSAQATQAEAELTLVRDKLARTRVLAPFDGIVVSGDLSQSLSAPVQQGDVLFEVAPLDKYRLVLKVDESDIEELQVGQRGDLALSSMPGEAFTLVVKSVTPVTKAAEGKNFFRVEADIGSADKRLRPGMQGIAKVEVGQRRLAWIWSHRVFDWVRLALWSWWP